MMATVVDAQQTAVRFLALNFTSREWGEMRALRGGGRSVVGILAWCGGWGGQRCLSLGRIC